MGIYFVNAGCIAVHDECDFIYGTGLCMYSRYASIYVVRVGVYVKCVCVNISCVSGVYFFYLYVVYILSVL